MKLKENAGDPLGFILQMHVIILQFYLNIFKYLLRKQVPHFIDWIKM